jgi:hypothetical protein
LLNADPNPTADFFTALQALPHWLGEKAVVMPSVQVLLNDKISQRIPTAFLMCDFFCLILVIIFYSYDVVLSIRRRDDETTTDNSLEMALLIPLYLGFLYFFTREVIQIISLVSLKSFHIYWLYDPINWLNVVFMFLILFWTIRMQTGSGDNTYFRTGTAFTVIFLWLKVLAFLRNSTFMIDSASLFSFLIITHSFLPIPLVQCLSISPSL